MLASILLPLFEVSVSAKPVGLDANFLLWPGEVEPDPCAIGARDGVLALGRIEACSTENPFDLDLQRTFGESRAKLTIGK